MLLPKKALIIAAGSGTRLRKEDDQTPKPLRRVAGLSLIERIILTSKRAGISEFVVVVGYQKERLIATLNPEKLGVKITFVFNPDFDKPNGVSVLCAKQHLCHENFILLMSDHIFQAPTLEEFRRAPLEGNKCLLAIDKKIASIFDLDDATKVKLEGSQIKSIGKTLTSYDAIDSGMFLATPELFDALEEASNQGRYSLSDGITILCERNQMGTFDIGNAWWQDVDTPETLQEAERFLLQSCIKPTDGFVSKNFNRKISLAITKQLLKTPISANQFTGFVSLVGLLSGYFASKGDYLSVLFGAFLFKWASILDGCDGELSKLKFTNSKLGQWLDTLSDNLTYICFILGLVIGMGKVGMAHIHWVGPATAFGLCMSLSIMFLHIIRSNSGTLIQVQTDFQKETKNNLVKKTLGKLYFMVKRDFFALAFLILALLGHGELILWLCMIATNTMWMVLLNTKMGARQAQVMVKHSKN